MLSSINLSFRSTQQEDPIHVAADIRIYTNGENSNKTRVRRHKLLVLEVNLKTARSFNCSNGATQF